MNGESDNKKKQNYKKKNDERIKQSDHATDEIGVLGSGGKGIRL